MDSFFSIYLMVLGDFSTSNFNFGNGSQSTILHILFSMVSFLMTVHLLNMLIAIMGNTFNARVEIEAEIQLRHHLRFIMDNWNLKDNVFYDKKQIKYLIAAFYFNEPNDQSLALKEVKDEMRDQFR